jgi:glucosamine kinase
MGEMQVVYILAIDGGQSSTSCLIGRSDGVLLASGWGGPAAVPSAALSEGLMKTALTACVSEALDSSVLRPEKFAAAYLSLTGGSDTALRVLPGLVCIDRIEAASDSEAALASGTFGEPGLALISGTGCIAYALNRRGEKYIGGGWGYLLGDEGSGFWIGLQAVRSALRAQDGRIPCSEFTRQVMQQLGVDDMREAQARIYNDMILRPEIARLTPLVMEWASKGEPVAVEIIDQAAAELAGLVKATSLKAGFTTPEERVVVAAGGVLRSGSPVFLKLEELLLRELPEYRFISPRFPPVVGAFILGLQLAKVEITADVLNRIEQTSSHLPTAHLKA